MRHRFVVACIIAVCLTVGIPQAGLLVGERTVPTAQADLALSVSPSTVVTGVVTSVYVTATLPSVPTGSSYLIDIGFDTQDTLSTAMYVPSSVAYASIAVNGTIVQSGASVLGHHVYLSGVVLSSSTSLLQISIGSTFGLRSLTDGVHYVTMSVQGTDIYSTFGGTFTSSGGTVAGALTLQSVGMGTSELGVETSFELNFLSGAVLYPGDRIVVKFPAGFKVPGSLPVSSVGMIETALGKVVNSFGTGVAVSGSTVTLTIPQPNATLANNASYFDASVLISVRFGATAGIATPTVAGTYTFELSTSRQTTPGTRDVTFGTAVSGVQLTAVPLTSGARAQLSLGFVTSPSGSLAANKGVVSLLFPAQFVLPASVLTGLVTVNGTPASATVSGHVLNVLSPVAVPSSGSVNIVISTSVGLILPDPTTGGYQVKVYTSSDAIPVSCPSLTPSASQLSGISVEDKPAVKGATASQVVSFTTGAGGALGAGDTISLFLPYGFMVPSTIDRTQVTIRTPATAASGIQPASVVPSPSSQSIILTLPSGSSIASGASVAVNLPAVITNPTTGGTFTVKVSTSRETTAVDSASFTIYDNPISTLRITPVTLDGKAGYYVSQPSFTLAVDGPAGVTLSAFYRIDDAGAFLPYDLKTSLAVKVPAGKHTVSYYSQDSLGNVEPTRSQQVLVDLTDPVITVASPTEKSIVVQSSINVLGHVSALDLAGVRLTVAGKDVPVSSDGAFSAFVALDHEGINSVQLVAASSSGRTTTLTLSVNYIARVTMSLVIGSPTVNLNNEFKVLEAAPFISKKGVTMVPLRFISEAFKANVVWDPVFKSVTLNLAGKTMRIQVGFLTADVSGKSFALQDAPVIVKGRTFVPLRFIAENFGAQVEWNGALKMVSIVYPKP